MIRLLGELGPEPVEISDNLWGQEIDVYYSMKTHWGNMREMMKAVFRFKGGDNIMAEEMSRTAPSADDMRDSVPIKDWPSGAT